MKFNRFMREYQYRQVPKARTRSEELKYGSSGRRNIDWCNLRGERFFRAFDAAFNLPPITEVRVKGEFCMYSKRLCRTTVGCGKCQIYLEHNERLSVNADEVRATPPEPIARAVTIFRHHHTYPGRPRNYKAATGLTVFPNTLTPHSPIAVITNHRLQRHAVSTWEQDGHGDRSNGERAFPIVYSPILSFAGYSPFADSSYVHTLAPPAMAPVGMPETQDLKPSSNLGGAIQNHKAERLAGDNRAASISSRSVPSYFTQGETLHFLSSSAEQQGSYPVSGRINKAQIVPEKGRAMSSESKLGTPDNFFLVCLRSDDVESLATPGFNFPDTPFNQRDYSLRSLPSTC